jgi:hypothetical protein
MPKPSPSTYWNLRGTWNWPPQDTSTSSHMLTQAGCHSIPICGPCSWSRPMPIHSPVGLHLTSPPVSKAVSLLRGTHQGRARLHPAHNIQPPPHAFSIGRNPAPRTFPSPSKELLGKIVPFPLPLCSKPASSTARLLHSPMRLPEAPSQDTGPLHIPSMKTLPNPTGDLFSGHPPNQCPGRSPLHLFSPVPKDGWDHCVAS